MEDYETSAEAIEARAAALRSKINPLPTGEAHRGMWQDRPAREVVDAAAARIDLPPAPFEDYLGPHALKLGDIAGDGLCQYRAFARATFSNESLHEELRDLAADFLLLNQDTYMENVGVTELQGVQLAALQRFASGGLVAEVSYSGWCEALKKGLIWGQDFTLCAMCRLMHVEARLVTNTRLQREGQPPRLVFLPHDYPDEHGGVPKATIYLGLNQAFSGEHYSTIEVDLEAAQSGPLQAARAPSDVSNTMSKKTDLDGTVGNDGYIKLADEEYSIAQLEGGVACGDNQHVYIFERDADQERLPIRIFGPIAHAESNLALTCVWHFAQAFVVYKMDLRTGAKETVRTYPLKTRSGKLKMEVLGRRLSGNTPAPVSIIEKDVESWLARLKASGVQETSVLAQATLDAITRYIDHLQLTRSAGSSKYMDGLGARMHTLEDTARSIKMQASFEAHSEGQSCFKVIVVGVEGSGKSTTLNFLLRNLMQAEHAADAPLQVTQRFSNRYPGETKLATEDIVAADQELHASIFSDGGPFAACIENMNQEEDDILPTGSGSGSLSALPTTVELDPEATEVCVKLTYRNKHEVDEALRQAALIREHRVGVLDEEDVPELEGVDVTHVAHMVCAFLNIKVTGGDGVQKICEYAGDFTLPPHKYKLLSRQRTFTIKGSRNEMLQKLNWLLMLHTVGPWSHWGIVREVTCVLPARDGVRMTVCDVPGFGNERSNPFRQGLVRDAVNTCEASTLLICLTHDRIEGRNNESRTVLQDAGVYEELFGDEMQRKIGQVVTTVSLDWSMEKKLNKKKATADSATRAAEGLTEQAEGWLRQSFVEAAKAKGIDASRVPGALEKLTKCFALDVRGTVEEKTGVNEFSMQVLTDALREASKDALKRRQRLLFLRLVFEVILPFYEEHHKLGYLRKECGSGGADPRYKVPSLRGDSGILQQTLNAGDLALMGQPMNLTSSSQDRRSSLRQRNELDSLSASGESLNSVHGGNVGRAGFVESAAAMRRSMLHKDVIEPILHKGSSHPTGVNSRWEEDNGYAPETFMPYRKSKSRQLGYDLKATEPQNSLLPDLVIPEIAHDSVYPLQQKLREMEKQLIDEPITAMTDMISSLFTSKMQDNIDAAGDDEYECKRMEGLRHTLLVNLHAWGIRHAADFKLLFASKVGELPKMHQESIRSSLTQHMPPLFKVRGNKQRKLVLGTKASSIAKEIANETLEKLLIQILVVMTTRLRKSFEAVVKQAHELMSAAIQRGDTKELESSGAFTISQHYARFTAGLISAIKQSGLADPQLSEHPQLEQMMRLAEQPAIMISPGGGLEELFQVEDDPMEADPPAAAPSAGQLALSAQPAVIGTCHACGTEYDDDEAKVLPLSRPCRFKPGSCFCETIPSEWKYCRLCVAYYRDKQKHKQTCLLRTNKMEEVRKKKNRKRAAHEAQLVSPSALRQRTSSDGSGNNQATGPVVRRLSVQEL